MTDYRSDDALNESAIDREIKAALSVEPSPEFLARVRTRVANEPAPVSWRWSWVATMASCVAVPMMVIAVVVVSRSGQRTESISVGRAPLVTKSAEDTLAVSPAVPTEQPRVTEPEVTTKADVVTKRPANVVSGSSRTTGVASGLTEPEVLIDPREARALRRLLAGVRDGSIDVSVLPPEPPQAVTTLQPLNEITPIVIEPLEPAAEREGVRQ